MRRRLRRVAVPLAAALAAGFSAAACGRGDDEPRQAADTPLGWVEVGDGPAHVVVHGGPGLDHRYLRPGLDVLARGRSLIYYDQRGLGSSVPESGPIAPASWQGTLDDLGLMAERFADGDGKVGIIAHSWGARPALRWALENPGRVRSLVLVSPVEPGSRFQDDSQRRLEALADSAARARLGSLRESAPAGWRTDREYRSRLWRAIFAVTEPDPSVLDRLDLDLHPVTARRGDSVARAVGPADQDLWGFLGGLDVPVLVVHGGEDAIAPAMVRELADSLPRGRAVVLEGVGHFPWAAAPERFFEAVDTFLSRVEAR